LPRASARYRTVSRPKRRAGFLRKKERQMKRILFVALALSLNLAVASAQESCESAGAAKASFLKKCKRDTCQTKALDRNGKRLAGAAKRSFMQKCEREA